MSQVWKAAWCRGGMKHASNAEGNTILIWKHFVPVDPAQRSLLSRRCAGNGRAGALNGPGRAGPCGSQVPPPIRLLINVLIYFQDFGGGGGSGRPFFIVKRRASSKIKERGNEGKQTGELRAPSLRGQLLSQ